MGVGTICTWSMAKGLHIAMILVCCVFLGHMSTACGVCGRELACLSITDSNAVLAGKIRFSRAF